MKSTFKNLSVVAIATAGLLTANQSFGQISFATPSGSTDSNGNVDAEVTFNLTGDVLSIVLTDLQQNLRSSGQLVSGLTFLVDNGTGISFNAATGSSGNLTTGGVAGDGSYVNNGSSDLTHWGASSSGSGTGFKVKLTTLTGGMPNELIVGPDTAGGTSGTSVDGGIYNNVNNGFDNFVPYVLGTATFSMTVSNLTSLNQISTVVFGFGTGSDTVNGAPTNNPPSAVPEPSTIISGLLLLVPLSIGVVRSLNRNRLQPIKTDK